MKISRYVFVALCLMLASCSPKESNDGMVETESLTGTEMTIPEDCNMMFPISIHNGTVISKSYNPEYHFIQSHIRNDTLSDNIGFISFGQGPAEMLNASIATDSSGECYVMNTSLGHAGTVYKVTDHGVLLPDDKYEVFPLDRLPAIRFTAWNFIVVDDSNIMILGDKFKDPTSVVSLIDYRRQIHKPVGFWPEDGFEGNPRCKTSAYQCNSSLVTNGKGKYLFATSESKYATIFSIQNGKCHIDNIIYNNPIRYEDASDTGELYRLLKGDSFGLKAKGTEKAIYILNLDKDFDGQPAKQIKDGHDGDCIDVFDWNGKLIRKLKLDHTGYNIFIDNNDSLLYLIRTNPETGDQQLLKYSLI